MAGLFPEDPASPTRASAFGASGASLFPDEQPSPKLRSAVERARGKSPEQSARVLKLQTRTGLPADLIERNLDAIEAEASRRGFDAERFRRESPILARWLEENPQHAALAGDDLENLGRLEWLIEAPKRGFRRGQAMVELGKLATQSIFRDLSADEHARLAELRKDTQRGGDLGAESWFGHALVGGAQQLPMLFGGLYAGFRTGLPASLGAAGAAALAGQLGPQVALPEEILTVPAAAVTGYYVGQTAGAARFGFEIEAGHAFEEFQQFKDEFGRPLDPDVARAAAIAAGGLNAGLEAFQLNVLMRAIPGLDKLAGGAKRSAIREALKSPTVRGALKELMLGYGKVLTLETSTEVAQRAITIMAGEIGKAVSGQPIEHRRGTDIIADLADEAIEAAQAFTFIAMPGPVMRAGRRAYEAREARKTQAFFEALGEGVKGSKTFERLPEKLQEFVERATKDGPIEQVYVDPATWRTYWQDQGLDPAQVAADVLGETTVYEEALASGHDMAIPMGRYATRIAPTEHNGHFSRELRLSPESMNAREAEAFEAELLARAQEQSRIEAEAAAGERALPIREDVVGQLIASGFDRSTAETYAGLYEAFFATLAERAGVDPAQTFRRYGLKIDRPLPDVLRNITRVDQFDALIDRLRAGEAPTDADMFGKSLGEFLREKGGVRDEGGELRSRAADKANRPFQRRLVRDTGMTLDTAREAAAEAGYIPMDSTVSDFLDLLDNEIRGEPVYSEGGRNDAAMALGQQLQQLDRFIRERGLDLNALSNEEIRRLLTEAAELQETGSGDVTFEQGGMAQVQTQEFKRWFGDWELAALDKTMRPVRGSDQTKAVRGEIVGKPITNIETGIVATVSGESFGKMMSRSAWSRSVSAEAHYQALGNLDTLFRLAHRTDSRSGRKPGDAESLGAVHHFAVPMPFDGDVVLVKILAKEYRRAEHGTRLYLVQAVEIEKPASIGGSQTSPQSAASPVSIPPAGFDDRLAQMLAAVKGDGVSKVVDAQGRPLGVYHGTARDLTELQPSRGGEYGSGIYLSDDKGAAWMYADRAAQDGGQNIMPVYARITNPYLATSRDVVRALGVKKLKAMGYDGIIATGTTGEKQYIAFDPEQIKSAVGNRGTFDPASGNILYQAKRGAIRFGAERQFRIELLDKADLSTFIHESGHFYLEVLGDVVADLKALDPASLNATQQRMLSDYDAVLKWLGVESREQIGTEQHEQWARGIEAYVMEGKAPSPALRSVFARFRAWLVAVYRSLTQLNVNLTPEVRAVMDRLFATDQEIEAAQREAEILPIFTTPEQAGMTDAEFAAYRATVQAASDQARDNLANKLMAQLQRERAQWWKGERERVQAEVAAEVRQQREYIALAFLQRGTQPDGTALPEGVEAFKLDRDALIDMYGKEFLKRLPRPYVYAAEGGIHPDQAAEVLGFRSGDELVTSIVNARPIRQLIEAETDARMRATYGDMLTDGTLADQARAAVQNDERAKVILAELRALHRKQREVRPFVAAEREGERQRTRQGLDTIRGIPELGVFTRIAEGRIAQLQVRGIRPTTYWMAARRASKAAIEAAAKNDFHLAAAEKQRELLNVELYRAAVRAREETDSIAEYMRSFGSESKRQRLGKAGQDYLDQIDALLDRFDFSPMTTKAANRRQALAQWIAQKERDGETVDLPDEVINEANRKPWRDMTYEELIGVRDSVRHIEHLARLKNRLLKAKDKRDLDAAVEEIEQSIREHAKRVKGRRTETRLPSDDAGRLAEGWFAMHRKLSSIVREMDGFKDGGVLWEYLIRPMNEAGNAEAVMNEQATLKLRDIFGVYQGKDQKALYDKLHIPAIGESLTKMGRLMVALNWGNADNRQKVKDGRGWNDAQVQAILDTLDQRDWQFVQSVWDFIDSYWPQIEAKEKRVNGIAPAKVEATPVATAYGEFRGGYFPLKYDDRLSPQAYGHRVEEQAKLMMQGAHVRATTKRGHTKARVEGVRQPVRLDFGVIFEHVGTVIHDLTHHEFLIDANRLLRHKSVSDTIIEVYGDVTYDLMRKAIEDVAAGDTAAAHAFEKSINWLRQGVSIAAMGWNVFTSLLQPLGISQSWVRIGPQWVGRGISRWIRGPAEAESTLQWVFERSDFMRLRGKTQMREINEIRNQVGVTTGSFSGWVDEVMRTVTLDTLNKQAVVDSYFWLIYKGQQVADIPTWLGAYEKAMAEGRDEATAVALADQAVLDSQGGGQIKDLAQIQRGGPLLKLWTNFYSYFNVTWNQTVEAVGRSSIRDPASIGRLAVDLLMLYTIPATLGYLMRYALRGDEEDDLAEEIVRENLSYMAGVLVGVREIGSVLQGFGGYEGPAGTRFFSSISKLVKQVEQGEADAAFWRALNDTAGILFHYPAGQVRRTVEGFVALQEGRAVSPSVLVTGPPRE